MSRGDTNQLPNNNSSGSLHHAAAESPLALHNNVSSAGLSSSPPSSVSSAPSPAPPTPPPPAPAPPPPVDHALSSLKTIAQQVIDRAGIEMPPSDPSRGERKLNLQIFTFFLSEIFQPNKLKIWVLPFNDIDPLIYPI